MWFKGMTKKAQKALGAVLKGKATKAEEMDAAKSPTNSPSSLDKKKN